MILDILVKQAKEKGACALINGAHTPQEFAGLYFTPQGREFCIKHNFPNVGLWRELKTLHLREYGIYCDAGHLKSAGGKMYGLVGKTTAELKFASNNNGKASLVILQHGAKAIITAGKHAVVRIEKDETSEVETINEDGTAIFLF